MEIPAHCDSERGLVHCMQHLWLTIYEMEMITAASAIDCERVYSWMGNFTIFNLNGCEARDTAWNCLSHYDIVAFHQESCFHQSCFQDSQMLCGVIKTDCNDAKMRLACSFSAGREITFCWPHWVVIPWWIANMKLCRGSVIRYWTSVMIAESHPSSNHK